MMRYLLIGFLVMIFAPVFSQVKKDSINGPMITFFEKQHDFGDIIQGDSVLYDFQFKNTGNEPLKIIRTVSTCSCTAATGDTSRLYMPGESGKVSIGFNSSSKPGSIPKQGVIQKQVHIFSNAVNATEKVNIRINVLPPSIKKTSKGQ